MNKQGSHADWAISMGIFLVYILILFIIIRPGVTPVYDEDVLLDLVEEKFSEEVKWIVKMTPLFVRTCKSDEKGEPSSITIEDKSETPWAFTTFNLFENNEERQASEYCIGGRSKVTLTCGGASGDIYCPFASKKIFRMYYIQNNPAHVDKLPELRIDLKGESKAELGSSENIEGINSDWLVALRQKGELEGGYDAVKDDWKFPGSRDFSISKDGNKIIGGKPYEQANIFVREWSDWEVKKNGEKVKVRVNIQIW